MNKILNVKEATQLAKNLHVKGKTIVVAGGCFDIFHKGHKKYLIEGKSLGDVLFVLLESDENIQKKKGKDRPINNQAQRAFHLSIMPFVDFVVTLPKMTKDSDYDTLLFQISPEVITATIGDRELKHKRRQAKNLKSRLVLIDKLENISTTKILNKYGSTRNNPL